MMKFKVKFKCEKCGEVYYIRIFAKSRKDATKYKRMFKDDNSILHRIIRECPVSNSMQTEIQEKYTYFELIDDKYINNHCHECCSDCSGYCGRDCPLDIEGSCERCEFKGGIKKYDGSILE